VPVERHHRLACLGRQLHSRPLHPFASEERLAERESEEEEEEGEVAGKRTR
jgi:hypothetical protein